MQKYLYNYDEWARVDFNFVHASFPDKKDFKKFFFKKGLYHSYKNAASSHFQRS